MRAYTSCGQDDKVEDSDVGMAHCCGVWGHGTGQEGSQTNNQQNRQLYIWRNLKNLIYQPILGETGCICSQAAAASTFPIRLQRCHCCVEPERACLLTVGKQPVLRLEDLRHLRGERGRRHGVHGFAVQNPDPTPNPRTHPSAPPPAPLPPTPAPSPAVGRTRDSHRPGPHPPRPCPGDMQQIAPRK